MVILNTSEGLWGKLKYIDLYYNEDIIILGFVDKLWPYLKFSLP